MVTIIEVLVRVVVVVSSSMIYVRHQNVSATNTFLWQQKRICLKRFGAFLWHRNFKLGCTPNVIFQIIRVICAPWGGRGGVRVRELDSVKC